MALKFYGKFKNYKDLMTCAIRPREGDISYLEDSKKYNMYKGGKWIPRDMSQKLNVGMTQYELEQTVYAQMNELTEEEINKGKEYIRKFHEEKNNKYYMILCNEISYFTVLANKKELKTNIDDAVINVIKAVGTIVNIAKDDEAVHIWVVDVNGIAHCLLLFGYDGGVVYYGQ